MPTSDLLGASCGRRRLHPIRRRYWPVTESFLHSSSTVSWCFRVLSRAVAFQTLRSYRSYQFLLLLLLLLFRFLLPPKETITQSIIEFPHRLILIIVITRSLYRCFLGKIRCCCCCCCCCRSSVEREMEETHTHTPTEKKRLREREREREQERRST